MSKNDGLIEEWRDKGDKEMEFLNSFLVSIDKTKGFNFQILKDTHTQVFNEIDCLQCGNCCKTTPPIFTRKDVKRIAKYLNTTPKAFERAYTIEDVDGQLVGIRVPCTFLNEDNTCSIYEVRPLACRTYPHTDDPAFAERPELNFNNTIVCPAAYHIVNRLQALINNH